MKNYIAWLTCLTVIFLSSPGFSAERTQLHLFEDILQKANASLHCNELRIDFLKNRPQAIPTLAEWMYDAWSPYDLSLTKEKLIASFKERLHDDCLPLTFVALKGEVPVGMISLKERSGIEFSDFPEDSLWGGSLLVAPEERNKGLGEILGKIAIAAGRCLKYEEIYFYTSNPESVPWYTKRGAQILATRSFHDHIITIFRMPIQLEVD